MGQVDSLNESVTSLKNKAALLCYLNIRFTKVMPLTNIIMYNVYLKNII